MNKRIFWIRAAILLSFILILGAISAVCLISPDGVFSSLFEKTHVAVEKAPKFGGFHIASLLICLSLAVITVIFEKRISDARVDGVVFSFGLAFLVLEVYKQLYYHLVIGNGSYNFSVLPLQLCSYAIYVCLLIPMLPESTFKRALYSFFGLFLTCGGCIVMGYPVLYADLALNLHTMLWHTMIIVLGVFLMRKRRLGNRILGEILPAAGIFAAVFALATAINVILTPYAKNSVGELNLFSMSPYIPTHYLIIGDVWEAVGWVPALLTYAVLFVFIGAPLMWIVARLLNVKKK